MSVATDQCFVDQLLVEAGAAGAHSVFEILQTHDRNSVHVLLQSPPPKTA